MEEKFFFNEKNVSVSNSRFVAEGQTYALSGITSVKSYRKDPDRRIPIIIGILGLFLLLRGGFDGIIFSLIIIAVAAAIWFNQKTRFSVLLKTASGEAKALAGADEEFISKVVAALNEAIVYRG